MDELIVSGKKYISSKRAAEISGYAKDYIGQLARGGKIQGTRVGRAWFIEEAGLLAHLGDEHKMPEEKVSVVLPRVGSSIQLPQRFYSSNPLPKTWGKVSYFHDDAELIPSFVKTSKPAIEENLNQTIVSSGVFSNDKEKKEVKIRVLERSIEQKPAVLRVGLSAKASIPFEPIRPFPVEVLSPKKKEKVPSRAMSPFVPVSLLAFAVVVLLVAASGFFVSSEALYQGKSAFYTASVFLSLEHVSDIIQHSPFFQNGVAALMSFYHLIFGSFFTYLKTGYEYVLNLF